MSDVTSKSERLVPFKQEQGDADKSEILHGGGGKKADFSGL
ncbi:MAG: hypothetical protein ABW202_05545 [Duganella sp.]